MDEKDKNLNPEIPEEITPPEADFNVAHYTPSGESLYENSGSGTGAEEPTQEDEARIADEDKLADLGNQTNDSGHLHLDIKDDEIWTYRVEGLAAPRINAPVKRLRLKQVIFIIVIVLAIALSVYFSVLAVAKDTFEYTDLKNGTYELKEFRNTGYITDIDLDYMLEIEYESGNNDPNTNFKLIERTDKPLTSLREYAFNCDEYLKKVTIGKNITSLDNKTFYSCRALEYIEVDDANPNYCDIDGVLYNKDKTEIICYPEAREAYLRQKYFGVGKEPENAESAEGKAFADLVASEEYRQKVLTYVIPSTVTTLGELCFNYSTLAEVYIPEGVTRIETLCFFRSTALSAVHTYVGDYAETEFVTREELGGVYASLPEGLEYIGSDAFSYNQELSYVYIPSSVTYIGHHAFWDCVYKKGGELRGLTEINVAADEDTFKKDCKKGDQWRPKYDYLLFKKNVNVNYSAERKG